jgi:DNA-binding MarR family transcriptional regulator
VTRRGEGAPQIPHRGAVERLRELSRCRRFVGSVLRTGQFDDRSVCVAGCDDGTVQLMAMPSIRCRDVVTDDELIEATLGAGRALVSVAQRSLTGGMHEVTLAQHRVLVELAMRGPQRAAELAVVLSVDRSTTTRMCDRLARKHLMRRRRLDSDRRGVRLTLTDEGRALVTAVQDRRRVEIAKVLTNIAPGDREIVVDVLRSFPATDAPEQDWSLGWGVASGSEGRDRPAGAG